MKQWWRFLLSRTALDRSHLITGLGRFFYVRAIRFAFF